MKKISIKGLFSFVIIGLLASCTVTPNPMSMKDVNERVDGDLKRMFGHQEPLNGPIDIYEAMARAVKYNLDHKLKMSEVAFAKTIYELESVDMLPKLTLDAGYSVRDNNPGSRSLDLKIDRLGNPSQSEEADHGDFDLNLTWNILDFGISYIEAKQKADEYLIAKERSRKMVHVILRDIRYAYWRVVSAQRVADHIKPLKEAIHKALKITGGLKQKKLRSPLEIMQYERRLWDLMRQVNLVQREVDQARIELAALMGLKPGTAYTVVEPTCYTEPLPLFFEFDRELLEYAALHYRPELREEDYRTRIAKLELDKTRMQMLPALIFNANFSGDSNRFLINNLWAESGVSLVWDLIRLVASGKYNEFAERKIDIANLRRQALSVAILTQVDVALLRYQQTGEDVKIHQKLAELDTGLYDHVQKAYRGHQADHLDLIQSKLSDIVSQIKYDASYADWHNAAAQLITSAGYDTLPRMDSSANIKELSTQIRKYYHSDLPKVIQDIHHQMKVLKLKKHHGLGEAKIDDTTKNAKKPTATSEKKEAAKPQAKKRDKAQSKSRSKSSKKRKGKSKKSKPKK